MFLSGFPRRTADRKSAGPCYAAFGSKVVLYDLDRGTEVEYKFVTTEEADLSKGLISTSSPIGRGLMGKRVGDSVKVSTPNGAREFEVRALQTIHEEM